MTTVVQCHTVGELRMSGQFCDFKYVMKKFHRVVYRSSEMRYFRGLLHFGEVIAKLVGTYARRYYDIVVSLVGYKRYYALFKRTRMFDIPHVEFRQTAATAAFDKLYVEPEFFQQTVCRDGCLRMYRVDVAWDKEANLHRSKCSGVSR